MLPWWLLSAIKKLEPKVILIALIEEIVDSWWQQCSKESKVIRIFGFSISQNPLLMGRFFHNISQCLYIMEADDAQINKCNLIMKFCETDIKCCCYLWLLTLLLHPPRIILCFATQSNLRVYYKWNHRPKCKHNHHIGMCWCKSYSRVTVFACDPYKR